jgi:putative aldouronate transport system substrate-binding protein
MKKSILSIIMTLVLCVTMLSGCGSGNSTKEKDTSSSNVTTEGTGSAEADVAGQTFNGVDISEPVTLKMYLLGDRSADFDKVYAEVNKILKEKLNATVEVQFLSWAEHDQRYSLLFSGGEDFDLIFTASGWAHYETTVAMGGFYPLSKDFLQTYAPDIMKVVPDVAWSQADIGGNVYMVPNYQNEFGNNVVGLRGDLLEKYGYTDITSFDQLLKFYDDVAKNEASISPLGTQAGGLYYQYLLDKGFDTVSGTSSKELFLYNTLNPEDKNLTYAPDWEGFTEYCKLAKDLFDKGYWSADSLATDEERQDGFLNGTCASIIWNIGSVETYVDQANKEHPEWKCQIFDTSPNVAKAVNPYINNGIAINAASKNKERAMMVLNEFYTNPAIQDLTSLGIEGTHWKAEENNQYSKLDAADNFGIDNNCNWGWVNMTIKRTEYKANPDEVDNKVKALKDTWNANIKPEHLFDGFSFDNANVSSQAAAVETVLTQYYTPLILGMDGDVDPAITELRKQLDNAGVQTIYEELKKQAADYDASKK